MANALLSRIVGEVNVLVGERAVLDIKLDEGTVEFNAKSAAFKVVVTLPITDTGDIKLLVALHAKEEHGHSGTIDIAVPSNAVDRLSGMITICLTQPLQAAVWMLNNRYSNNPNNNQELGKVNGNLN